MLQIYASRGGGFTKSQHFDSPPVSPVPRTPSSPRISSFNNLSLGENTPGISGSSSEEKKQRSSKKISTSVNGSTTPNNNQQQVLNLFFIFTRLVFILHVICTLNMTEGKALAA